MAREWRPLPVGFGDPKRWVVTDAGYTPRGWPWAVVRIVGGRTVRVTIHPAQQGTEALSRAIDGAVALQPKAPASTAV